MELHRRTFLGLSAAALAAPALHRMSASAQDATPTASNETLEIYLLTIRGTLAPATIEDARGIHNATAGAPESIAAARSLGDVSHMVYTPTTPATSGAGEILFVDYWTSADGLNQFFANPQVQEQAAQIFTDRDPVVWVPAEGFVTYHLPAPAGQNDRFVVIVRGTVASREEAMALHNSIVANEIGAARIAGDLSHDAYFRLTAPDAEESLEYLAIDIWKSAEGLQEFYAQPDLQAAFAGLFSAAPTVSIWTAAPGEWAEW
jgi:quinol monooxygenase YgiN